MEKQYSAAEKIVQQQLDAYNKGDLEAFVKCYAEDVILYNFPNNEIQIEGRTQLKESYHPLFAQNPDLHCELLNRMVLGDKIIDHERISGLAKSSGFEAVAIYQVKEGNISKCWFVFPDLNI